jgi:hypothetical protein
MADTGVSAEEISFDLQKCTICTFKIRIIDIKHIRLSNNGTETIVLIFKHATLELGANILKRYKQHKQCFLLHHAWSDPVNLWSVIVERKRYT